MSKCNLGYAYPAFSRLQQGAMLLIFFFVIPSIMMLGILCARSIEFTKCWQCFIAGVLLNEKHDRTYAAKQVV